MALNRRTALSILGMAAGVGGAIAAEKLDKRFDLTESAGSASGDTIGHGIDRARLSKALRELADAIDSGEVGAGALKVTSEVKQGAFTEP